MSVQISTTSPAMLHSSNLVQPSSVLQTTGQSSVVVPASPGNSMTINVPPSTSESTHTTMMIIVTTIAGVVMGLLIIATIITAVFVSRKIGKKKNGDSEQKPSKSLQKLTPPSSSSQRADNSDYVYMKEAPIPLAKLRAGVPVQNRATCGRNASQLTYSFPRKVAADYLIPVSSRNRVIGITEIHL